MCREEIVVRKSAQRVGVKDQRGMEGEKGERGEDEDEDEESDEN